jgi:hypothetical protein
MCKDGKGCKHIAGCQAALDAGALSASPGLPGRPCRPVAALPQLDAIDAAALDEGEARSNEPWDGF